ncbi:serine/threonine-protein phosphatase 1 regulatory subunit 10-like [Mustela nigripes]|uniref:serine/threonine-protein phosphatase 1 regulatory subunit 10-like n=1 Tax=Mustela nigripes TaxID=77151 RepID=UPI002814BEAE|nr:serine/threonine-protein phosphatase 1 regulatory subunit 10-like [Mustela nigripes]
MTQHSGPSRAPRREAQAPRSGFLAPNPANPADLTRSRGLALRTLPGIRDPGPQAGPFRPPEVLPSPRPSSSYPGLSSQTAPVQLRAGRGQSQARPRPSSYQEAAGRAGRAGQAAQEKPRLVPPLPPRGPGNREARGSSDRQQPAHVRSPARGSSGPQLRGPRGAAGSSGGWPRPSRSWRGKGGGSGESGAGKLRRAAELGGGGANRLSRQRPHRPPGGALLRPVGRRRGSPNLGNPAAGRVALGTRTLWPCGPQTPLSAVAFLSCTRSQHPRTLVHARSACFAPCLHT